MFASFRHQDGRKDGEQIVQHDGLCRPRLSSSENPLIEPKNKVPFLAKSIMPDFRARPCTYFFIVAI